VRITERYKLVTQRLDWASAGKYCADRNAQLVAIANKEEQKALTLYLKKQAKGTHSTRGIPFVINYGPVYLPLSQWQCSLSKRLDTSISFSHEDFFPNILHYVIRKYGHL